MGTVRIEADLPMVGDIDIHRAFYDGNITETGTEYLAEAIAEAGNAVLRAYGIKQELSVISEDAAALKRLRKAQGVIYSKGSPVGD